MFEDTQYKMGPQSLFWEKAKLGNHNAMRNNIREVLL